MQAKRHRGLPSNSFGYQLAIEHFNYNPLSGSIKWIKKPSRNIRVGDFAGHVYSSGGKKYCRIVLRGVSMGAHNLAYLMMTGKLPDVQLDHIDGNGLNNRWKNLRNVTVSENHRNHRIHKNNKSGVSGIHWNKNAKSWQVRIMSDIKNEHLGYTRDFFEACCMRKSAERKYKYHENHGTRRPL